MKPASLGNFEELLLLAIVKLGDEAFGLSISQAVSAASRRNVSLSAVYTTLERMKKKGMIKEQVIAGGEDRGNRPRRLFIVDALGIDCLREAELSRSELRAPKTILDQGWVAKC